MDDSLGDFDWEELPEQLCEPGAVSQPGVAVFEGQDSNSCNNTLSASDDERFEGSVSSGLSSVDGSEAEVSSSAEEETYTEEDDSSVILAGKSSDSSEIEVIDPEPLDRVIESSGGGQGILTDQTYRLYVSEGRPGVSFDDTGEEMGRSLESGTLPAGGSAEAPATSEADYYNTLTSSGRSFSLVIVGSRLSGRKSLWRFLSLSQQEIRLLHSRAGQYATAKRERNGALPAKAPAGHKPGSQGSQRLSDLLGLPQGVSANFLSPPLSFSYYNPPEDGIRTSTRALRLSDGASYAANVFICGGSDLDGQGLQEFSSFSFRRRLAGCLGVSSQVFVTVDALLYEGRGLPLSLDAVAGVFSLWRGNAETSVAAAELAPRGLKLTVVLTKLDLLLCTCSGGADEFSWRMKRALKGVLRTVGESPCWALMLDGQLDFQLAVGTSIWGVFSTLDVSQLLKGESAELVAGTVDYARLYSSLARSFPSSPCLLLSRPLRLSAVSRQGSANLLSITLLPRFFAPAGTMLAFLLFAGSDTSLGGAVEVSHFGLLFTIHPKLLMVAGRKCSRVPAGAVFHAFVSHDEGLSVFASLREEVPAAKPPEGSLQFIPFPYRSAVNPILLPPAELERAALLVSLGFSGISVRGEGRATAVYAWNEEVYNDYYRLLHAFSALTFGPHLGHPPSLYAISAPEENRSLKPEGAEYYELDDVVSSDLRLAAGILVTQMPANALRGSRVVFGERVEMGAVQTLAANSAAFRAVYSEAAGNRDVPPDTVPTEPAQGCTRESSSGAGTSDAGTPQDTPQASLTALDASAFLTYLQASNSLAVDASLRVVYRDGEDGPTPAALQSSLPPGLHSALAHFFARELSQARASGLPVTDVCLRVLRLRVYRRGASGWERGIPEPGGWEACERRLGEFLRDALSGVQGLSRRRVSVELLVRPEQRRRALELLGGGRASWRAEGLLALSATPPASEALGLRAAALSRLGWRCSCEVSP